MRYDEEKKCVTVDGVPVATKVMPLSTDIRKHVQNAKTLSDPNATLVPRMTPPTLLENRDVAKKIHVSRGGQCGVCGSDEHDGRRCPKRRPRRCSKCKSTEHTLPNCREVN